jgi:hypothetical protein
MVYEPNNNIMDFHLIVLELLYAKVTATPG